MVTTALKYRPIVAENTTSWLSRARVQFATCAAISTLCLAAVASNSPEFPKSACLGRSESAFSGLEAVSNRWFYRTQIKRLNCCGNCGFKFIPSSVWRGNRQAAVNVCRTSTAEYPLAPYSTRHTTSRRYCGSRSTTKRGCSSWR